MNLRIVSTALLAVAVSSLWMAFAGTASATTFTSPLGTIYTGEIKGESEGHLVLDNPIAKIECAVALQGKVESHGEGVTAKGSVTALSFTGCTNSWHVTVINKGTFEAHGIGSGNATLTSSGTTVEATRLGVICRYATSNTKLGTLTGGTPATLHLEASIPFHSGSFLCGAGSIAWTGSYKATSPATLTVDQVLGPAATTLTTSLSGEEKSGEKITVEEGAKVKDQATLSGENAGVATGTIKYFVYSDNKCESLVTKAGETAFTEGKVPVSEEKTLEAGVYYWQAEYSGDSLNSSSKSTCGKEVLTVEAPKAPEWVIQELPAVEGAQGFLYGISCPSSELCIGVGNYLSKTNNLIAQRWNGKEWFAETLPTSGALAGISCSSTSFCMAVGYKFETGGTQALSWNGSEWKVLTMPTPKKAKASYLDAVSCTSASQCTATGWFESETEGRRTLVERWNGSEWVIQTSLSPGGGQPTSLTGVSCTSSTTCMASGFYYTIGDIFPMAQQWNGSEWSSLEVPKPIEENEAFLEAVSCTSSTACTAVGRYGGPGYTTLAERWNGTEWKIQPIPNPTGESILYGVSCASSTACTAAGVTYISGELQTVAEAWDGTEWELQPTPNVAGAEESLLFSVSCPSANDCVAAGHYREKRAVGPAYPLILRYE
jgi:hypothetical protein